MARAFSLLELFRKDCRPLTALEIQTEMDLPQASALVLSRELCALGYLNFNPSTRAFFPTERVADLGAWLPQENRPAQQWRPIVDEIARLTQETTSLCSVIGRHLHIEYSAPGTMRGSILIQLGLAAPLPCSAAGRAVLATFDDSTIATLCAEVRRKDRQNPFDARQVQRDIAQARTRGCLMALDLMIEGVGAVAFPLQVGGGDNHFAVVVAAPSPRIKANSKAIERDCRQVFDRSLRSNGRMVPANRLAAIR